MYFLLAKWQSRKETTSKFGIEGNGILKMPMLQWDVRLSIPAYDRELSLCLHFSRRHPAELEQAAEVVFAPPMQAKQAPSKAFPAHGQVQPGLNMPQPWTWMLRPRELRLERGLKIEGKAAWLLGRLYYAESFPNCRHPPPLIVFGLMAIYENIHDFIGCTSGR